MVQVPLTTRLRVRDSITPALNKLEIGRGHVVDTATGNSLGSWPVWSDISSYPASREKIWDEKHPGPPYVTGGDLTIVKLLFPWFQAQGIGSYWSNVFSGGGSFRHRYDGGFSDPLWFAALDELNIATYYDINILTPNSTLLPDLSSLGAKAYARLRPDPQKANIGLTLAEMRELPRMLKGSAKSFHDTWKLVGGDMRSVKMRPKLAADNFLLYQFGWKPFLKDMASIMDAVENSNAHFAQIKRDNGQWIRRRRADKRIESEELIYERTDIAGVNPANAGNLDGIYSGPYSYTIKLQEYTDVWYEGVFKYYRPAFDDSTSLAKSPLGAMHRNLTLYGAYVSPSVIYKATPWSWCIDWFSNVGDVMQRAEDWATDSMVSKYMYLMHRHRRRFRCESRFVTSDGSVKTLLWDRDCVVKRRQGGNNWFTFKPVGNLTPRQLAILAALGISRGSR